MEFILSFVIVLGEQVGRLGILSLNDLLLSLEGEFVGLAWVIEV